MVTIQINMVTIQNNLVTVQINMMVPIVTPMLIRHATLLWSQPKCVVGRVGKPKFEFGIHVLMYSTMCKKNDPFCDSTFKKLIPGVYTPGINFLSVKFKKSQKI